MKRFNLTVAFSLAVILSMGSQLAHAELLALFEGDKLNGPHAGVALDSSGKGNHGALLGNSAITTNGHTGGALDFNPGAGTAMRVNPAGNGAFDSVSDNQAFTVGFWMAAEESAVGPSNQSVFWAVGVEGETDRAYQSHAPWSNGQVYLDIGGCCTGTQRINGPIDREFWDAATGEEWTHYAYTLEGDFGDAAVYINGEPVLERLGPTDLVPPLASFWVGSANNFGNQFQGRLDDFFVADEALSIDDIGKIVSDGVRSVFTNLPAEPAEYTPVGADLALVDLDPDPSKLTLGGHATINGGVDSWGVDQVFRTSAAGTEVVAFADLSSAGVGGTGNIGAANSDVALGDVNITNDGADNMTVEFRIGAATSVDPILGFGETFISQTFTLEGSGGGAVDPFTLLGDLNQDGLISFPDFLILSANFGAMKEPAGAVDLPEPTSGLLLLLGMTFLGMLRKRR